MDIPMSLTGGEEAIVSGIISRSDEGHLALDVVSIDTAPDPKTWK